MMIMMDEQEARFVGAIITYERWFSLHCGVYLFMW